MESVTFWSNPQQSKAFCISERLKFLVVRYRTGAKKILATKFLKEVKSSQLFLFADLKIAAIEILSDFKELCTCDL